jgi:hypothetical protein
MGFEPEKIMQIDSLDSDTRRRVWDVVYIVFWSWEYMVSSEKYDLAKNVSRIIFKETISNFENLNEWGTYGWDIRHLRNQLEELVLSWQWLDVCELIEYLWEKVNNINFQKIVNVIFEEEKFSYRFVDWLLVEVTNTNELKEIEDTKELSKESANHFKKAVEFFSERVEPKYDKVIEESIKWIEALLREVIWDHSKTLWEAIKEIKKDWTRKEYQVLWEWLDKLWWFASNNVRHAGKPDWIEIDFATAKFILVLASSIANYIQSIR